MAFTSTAKPRASYGPVLDRCERSLRHLALAAVGEQLRGLRERQPAHLVDLVCGLERQVAEAAAPVAEEEEADDLEDPLAPPRVHVLDVAELLDEPACRAGFLAHLPHDRVPGILAGVDVAFREGPETGLLPRRADRSEHPLATDAAYEHSAGGELSLHASVCNTAAGRVRLSLRTPLPKR